MLLAGIILLFVVGYLVIALEHPLHIDKAATALFIGASCWALYIIGIDSFLPMERIPEAFQAEVAAAGGHVSAHELAIHYAIEGQFLPLIGEIAYILFFLMGAMTIVELVDAYEGFKVITDRIKTLNKVRLLWTVCFLTFFLSAVLDNLTTTIVMVSLMKKLVRERETRLFFCGMIVVSANAGGAWTVIGDVTTTMLWIGDKISTFTVMSALIIPSLICMIVPLIIASLMLKGDVERPERSGDHEDKTLKPWHSTLFLSLGFAGLIFVPIFKSVTHLPPFMGMMFSLSVIWIVSEFVKHDLDEATRSSTNVVGVLKKIDTASILFFLGILLAVGTLQSTGVLRSLAGWLTDVVPNMQVVALVIGLLSAIVDNVPLVAAGIGMYDFPKDDTFWLFLAYCAGTGGSCLIIGSAAGVAAMGLEKIDFIWYIKRVSLWALVGYLSGAGAYVVQEKLMPRASAAAVEDHAELPASESHVELAAEVHTHPGV
ncbi:sodium:proton antiporter NhaD [Aureliella helgolandensis]|uniref:Na(+)/H(+) antiporter NhaD n=1 Tax=Aureliella helgolandensis TaxID=2527968 RepID=A0A518G2L6_9BACT|nr:sodium:proton antiporter NhaD [Aureliella helgolandensis]QDV22832.1 Na(+)/H(+) antiporter NhaD [Aureliella helgolandensis]